MTGAMRIFALVILPLLTGLAGCTVAPPDNPHNACDIFREKGGWFDAMEDAEKKWGTPIHVQLAIMAQESSFIEEARPPREWVFGVIPWGRQSSAYGYAQAKDDTWDWYRKKTGNRSADRDDFDDAADFIAWYVAQSSRMLGISKWDARNQYLAYHEGQGGFKRKTYNKKAWLLRVADKVDRKAKTYGAQLAKCRDDLESPWWNPF